MDMARWWICLTLTMVELRNSTETVSGEDRLSVSESSKSNCNLKGLPSRHIPHHRSKGQQENMHPLLCLLGEKQRKIHGQKKSRMVKL